MSTPRVAVYPIRRHLMATVFILVAAVLVVRAVHLQSIDSEFLQAHGNDRYLRTISIPADRGTITDRHGEPLASSAPVDSVWTVPRQLAASRARWPELVALLGMSGDQLEALIAPRLDRGFLFIKRRIGPELARQVMDLGIPGIFLEKEYRRFYPSGEVAAHLIGFTDMDNRGQEGIELSYEEDLRSTAGAKQVIQNRHRQIVEDVVRVRAPSPGKTLALSIDRRIQYVAYRELKAAVQANKARSGSLVVLDAASGEVLAMVNQPAFNPNNRQVMDSDRFRNRAVTDVFEPGSTIKPFTVAAGLESGAYRPTTRVDTRPGVFKVGRNRVRDMRDYGELDVAGIIQKSSNVGVSKIALSMPAEQLWQMLHGVGFGARVGTGFPGEPAGRLRAHSSWRPIEHATLAFGYGLSVTNLQLARAYAVLASGGLLLPISLKRTGTAATGKRVLSEKTARQVRAMLELVVAQGTGKRAQIPGYRVAGKTGTVHKTVGGRYSNEHYMAMFAGMVPASHPRLVAVVVVDEPHPDRHFGGQVAAPIFARVMAEALRLMNIPPDDLSPNADSATDYMADVRPTAEHPG